VFGALRATAADSKLMYARRNKVRRGMLAFLRDRRFKQQHSKRLGMQQSISGKQWYALQVRTRFERVVGLHARGKGYEEYVPTYRSRRQWTDRVREIELPLFAGYIFCRFDLAERLPLLMIPGVKSVVCFGGAPLPVPEREIAAVQRVLNSGMQYGPWQEFSAGQLVQVKYGPLCGLEGRVVQVKTNFHLIIAVNILRRSVSVEIDRDCVIPVGENQTEIVA
jgi:transcription antitermination factor NusG